MSFFFTAERRRLMKGKMLQFLFEDQTRKALSRVNPCENLETQKTDDQVFLCHTQYIVLSITQASSLLLLRKQIHDPPKDGKNRRTRKQRNETLSSCQELSSRRCISSETPIILKDLFFLFLLSLLAFSSWSSFVSSSLFPPHFLSSCLSWKASAKVNGTTDGMIAMTAGRRGDQEKN